MEFALLLERFAHSEQHAESAGTSHRMPRIRLLTQNFAYGICNCNCNLQTKKGLAGQSAPDSSKPLGRLDPASQLKGKILIADGTVYDVMLNLVDVSKNSDKYFILQVMSPPTPTPCVNCTGLHWSCDHGFNLVHKQQLDCMKSAGSGRSEWVHCSVHPLGPHRNGRKLCN
jgi:hypothetical protein